MSIHAAPYQTLFAAVREPCVLTSTTGVIEQLNPAAAELLGVRADAQRGKPLAAFVDPADRPVFRHAVNAATETERAAVLFGLTSRSRRYVPVAGELIVHRSTRGATTLLWLLRPLGAEGEHAEEILAHFVDARTASLRGALTALEESTRILEYAAEELPVGLLVLDPRAPEPHIANRALLEMVGASHYDRTSLLGPDGDVLPDGSWPPDVVLKTRRPVLESRVTVRRPDGDDSFVLASAVPIMHRGRLTAVAAVFVDLSRLDARERAEADFVANASHNLRTPLTIISTAIEILQGGAKDDPFERDRFLAHIEREVARMALLTRSLLTLVTLDLGQDRPPLRPTPADAVLRSVATGVDARPGVEVVVEAAPGLVALTDAGLLEQALANLAENASKYTHRGRITLAAERAPDGIVFRVSDTGTGIPDASRELFSRFVRRDTGGGGFGLGLAIVRKIADVLSADVELQSEVGVGTTVSLLVPAEPAQLTRRRVARRA
jgi:signal transduction histidine kinase